MFILVRSDGSSKYTFTNLSGILLERGGLLTDCYSKKSGKKSGNSSRETRLAFRDLTSESGKNNVQFSVLMVLKCSSGGNDGNELKFNHDLNLD